MTNVEQRGPVVIAGVGGSGTRAVARVIQELGFFIGNCVNGALDNLWFALLFRRPGWYDDACKTGTPIVAAFALLQRALAHGLDGAIEPEERRLLEEAVATNRLEAHIGNRQIADDMIVSRPPPLEARGWGWKAPTSHIYLPYLAACFPRLRFIHVIRHGLDMAYSSNQSQALLWGHLFELPCTRAPVAPRDALAYWIAANRRAVSIGERLLGDRFLLLNFDEFCAEPATFVRRVAEFLGVENLEPTEVGRLAALVERPPAAGRYREHPISEFTSDQIEAVRDFGFEVAG